jgi:hypothetical protein
MHSGPTTRAGCPRRVAFRFSPNSPYASIVLLSRCSVQCACVRTKLPMQTQKKRLSTWSSS